jgi:hypothetical protein
MQFPNRAVLHCHFGSLSPAHKPSEGRQADIFSARTTRMRKTVLRLRDHHVWKPACSEM